MNIRAVRAGLLSLTCGVFFVDGAYAETRTTNGTASLDEFIGNSGCPLEDTEWSKGETGCKPGETCSVGIRFGGAIAARLYDLLAKHGVQRDDAVAGMLGSAYVRSSDELLFCFDYDGQRTCNLTYDPLANKALPHSICD